jgi:hypothetical protein
MTAKPVSRSFKMLLAICAAGLCLGLASFGIPGGIVHAQQPTGSIPTVTGTPAGPVVTVYTDQQVINVYAGPGAYDYPKVGVLLAGEKAYALAYSVDEDWIQIIYLGAPGGKGWIYAPLVSFTPGELPRVPDPATATPRTTPTLDPTWVAAYGIQLEPSRQPTFTPPAPLEYPTFTSTTGTGPRLPIGLAILILALIGVLGAVISFLRGR